MLENISPMEKKSSPLPDTFFSFQEVSGTDPQEKSSAVKEKSFLFWMLRKVSLPLLLEGSLFLIAGAFLLDLEIARWFFLSPAYLNRLAFYITHLGDSGPIFILTGTATLIAFGLRFLSSKTQTLRILNIFMIRCLFILFTNAGAGLAVQIIKNFVGRARPLMLLENMGPFSFHPFAFKAYFMSFPSGHTTTAFATAVALSYFMPRWSGRFMVLALLVGISRLILEEHYLSDVLAGAVLGSGTTLILANLAASYGWGFKKIYPSYAGVRVRASGLLLRWFHCKGKGKRREGALEKVEEGQEREEKHLLSSPSIMLTDTTPSISILVPVRNEKENVRPLIDEICYAMRERSPFEIIYIDDGSWDGTGEILRTLSLDFSFLRVLFHRESCGQSAAIRTGVRNARGRIIVTLDGDGQNDPAFIPLLLDQLEKEGPFCGLIQGERQNRQDTWSKKIQSRLANAIRRWVLKDATRDTGCGLKAFPRDVYLALPYFDALHRFMPCLVKREGFKVQSLLVRDRVRYTGVSNYGFFDRLWVGFIDLLGVYWLCRRRRRLPVLRDEL